jgi:hypothetical protein
VFRRPARHHRFNGRTRGTRRAHRDRVHDFAPIAEASTPHWRRGQRSLGAANTWPVTALRCLTIAAYELLISMVWAVDPAAPGTAEAAQLATSRPTRRGAQLATADPAFAGHIASPRAGASADSGLSRHRGPERHLDPTPNPTGFHLFGLLNAREQSGRCRGYGAPAGGVRPIVMAASPRARRASKPDRQRRGSVVARVRDRGPQPQNIRRLAGECHGETDPRRATPGGQACVPTYIGAPARGSAVVVGLHHRGRDTTALGDVPAVLGRPFPDRLIRLPAVRP